jgi:oligopeptide/dipeptide ABC transporter ATP-binding protein
MEETLLVVDDLRVIFPTPRGDVRAVWGVSFKVERGKIYCIVGESGCGKTATGRAILNLVPPPGRIIGGRILFNGEDIVRKSEQEMQQLRGRRIAMVFQDPAAALNPLFTIGQQLHSIMRRHRIVSSEEDFQRRSLKLLKDLELPNPQGILGSYPHRLSGGMQQRAMIAMALAAEPDLIIADEPTSALDVTIQSQILDLLVRLRNNRGVTILLITHDLGVVAETCDEVAIFYMGAIVEKGVARDIFHRTRHPYTRGLLEALPNPQRWGQELQVISGSIPANFTTLPGCLFEPRCPYRLDICREVKPPLVGYENAHEAACHLDAEFNTWEGKKPL